MGRHYTLEDCLLPDEQSMQECALLGAEEEEYQRDFALDGDMSDLAPEAEALWMEHASEHFVVH